jgi:cell filamentation protein
MRHAARGNSFFARPEFIVPELQRVFDRLATEDFLRGSDAQEFCGRAAYLLGEMNAIHPFREGNGRAQREFFRELALQAGYELAWDLVAQEEMYAASIASFQRGGSEEFAALLKKIIRPVR